MFKHYLLLLLAFNCLSIVQAQVNLSQGLVMYLAFNGNTFDASGNGNNATNFGATLTSDEFGNPNSAYLFNGTSSFMQITNNSSLQPEGIRCNITDNGPGFPLEAIEKDYKSKGINLIKSKIGIVEILTHQSIKFEYHNLYSNLNKIIGSETIFTFPFITFDYDNESSNH